MFNSATLRIAATLPLLVACAAPDAAPPGACDGAPCTIDLRHVATLSDSVEPGLFAVGRALFVQQDGAGRFYVPTLAGDRIAVFDADGHLLTLLGRRGRGPGEYSRGGLIFTGPGDSVFVSDERLGRVTVYSPALDVARVFPAPWPPAFIAAGGLIVTRRSAGRDDGRTLHRVDERGTVVRSFGSDTTPAQPRPPARVVAPARSGHVWSVTPGRYVVEKWSPQDGTRLDAFAVRSTWFRESTPSYTPDLVRPEPVIVGLWEDPDGILWVLGRVADERWRAPDVAERDAERAFDVADYSATYDWILDAIDPATHQLLATRRFPDYMDNRPPSHLLVTLGEVTARETTLHVWRPVLRPTGGQP